MAALVLITAVAAGGIAKLRFDSSLSALTDPNDSALAFHKKAVEIFGDEEIGVLALLADDVYTPEVLTALRSLTGALAAIDGVARTVSLTNVKDPVADVFDPPPLLPDGPVRAKDMARLRERVHANPLYVPHLVAADGRAAAVNVIFGLVALGAEGEARVDNEVAAILAGYDGPGKIYYTGISHIRVRSVRLMREDLLRFLPLSLAAMMVVLWLTFRSLRAVALPLVSQAFAVVVLLGLMGTLGASITLPTLVLPSLLLVIGASYAIHVTTAYLEAERAGVRGRALMEGVLKRVGLPVVVSAFTTAVGFGSLAIHPIPAIAGLGEFAVLGIAIAAGGCLLGLPLAFLSLPTRRIDAGLTETDSGLLRRLDALVVHAGTWAIDNRRAVFAIATALLVVSVVGAMRIRVDTDFLKAFRPSSDVRVAHRAVTESLAGPNVVSVVITGLRPGYFRDVTSLRRVKDFQDFVATLENVSASISLVDYLEAIDSGLQASDGGIVLDQAGRPVEAPSPPSFWDAPGEQLPAVLEFVALTPKTFSGLVDSDFQRLNITVRTEVSGSRETAALVEQVEAYADAMLPAGVVTRATGPLVVASHVADQVIGGQVESVGVAFSVIFLALSIMFLSLRVGLAAMIPNLLPVVAFFGIMGWFRVELNLATSIIAAVALGIGVDDTIHYMAQLNRVVKTTDTQREALIMTLALVGRPIVTTSLTLTAGFLVMVMSGFSVITAFGALSAITMMIALVANLVLLPAILATVPVISVWDLVSSRLGQAPHKTIPLFDGLGRLAVRLIVLLGNLRTFETGSIIMKRGEPGNEMYLLLGGEAEVQVSAAGVTRPLAELARGDVFGEMGLLRSSMRTADVVALSDVEVLVINEAFLRRLRQRYPRFASRFFLNIARILSDRLEAANRRAATAVRGSAGAFGGGH